MILEALITTTNPDGSPHLAPMGPKIVGQVSNLPEQRQVGNLPHGAAFTHFLLRPFPTSNTYRNLLNHPEGVLHVTDDAALIARAAVGAVEPFPHVREADHVRGWILTDCCRFYEFRVAAFDDSEQRVRLDCEVIHHGTLRDFWGFNRAKHAVLEAAILATRLHLLQADEVDAEFRKLRVIVDKTGGPAEHDGMSFLEAHLAKFRAGDPT